ncbi:Frataxin [Cylindrobasidium torrendii FP15055 ss-10]|uniref:ferroxidase n=1 Tax=Cylindrobasidium torrendii FP15055 ss-10 TaxID=1314674 RepID=A0A0D7AZ64_9AGAR|nr:Frataxin [Cylindrobasidium torrendii FP15055 ss-10]
MEEYHKLSDKVMDGLTEQLEGLVDQCGRDDYEVEYSSGVLTLSVGEHGTYVINKQPPNKQIWLSSPHSGPKRYDYMTDGTWRYTRDNHALLDLLNEELAPAFTDFTKLAIDE